MIIVTTEGREDDFKRGLEAGASAYLRKPFTPEALIELLRGLLAHPVRAAPIREPGRSSRAQSPDDTAHRARSR